MLNHVVIGKGNVGVDLYNAIKKLGDSARILTRSDGFEFPESLPSIHHLRPDYIWVTAGAGSIESAKKNFRDTLDTHVLMPAELMKEFANTHVGICFFSSDYAANETEPSNPELGIADPKSLYALSKSMLEKAVKIENRPFTSVVRVGTIYGDKYYDRCLPGKLHARYPSPCTLDLPMNRVTPTPSFWIADMLLKHRDKLFNPQKATLHHLAPHGGISVHAWGQKILGDEFKVNSKGFDNDRPLCSNLGCSLDPNVPDWTELWNSPWYANNAPARDLVEV